ncbi:MAG: hypothetical protein ACFFE5_12025, partial [Candidatus Thorarchaeota archaeon]
MVNNSISSFIIDKFGLNLYQKSLKFLSNKINLIDIEEDPILIRSLILDNEREFHLIIDEKNNEIFHDCPSFLIHSEKNKKICVHLIKLLSIIKSSLAQKILENFKSYILTSEDLGSQKKSKSFLMLANRCFKSDNCVEALSYMNKAIFNQFETENIIETYLNTAIDNNLFVEFFEFLQNGYENDLGQYFLKFDDYIEKGFKKFLNTIPKYSFFNLLKIIESINKILEFKEISFMVSHFNKLKAMISSTNFNNQYYSLYLIKKNYSKLIELNPLFKDLISEDSVKSLKITLLNYFFSEIDNFCIFEKLKLLKKQFGVIGIPIEEYYDEYKKYKVEIKELEKKVYMKKFAFLKLLMAKHNIKRAKGDFKKKRNTYIVNHDENNLKNPVYHYIVSRIGFFGLKDQTIKSSEIGINYFIMKELFLDDLSSFQDVYYYKQQFWGENDDYEIKPIEGISILSEKTEYSHNAIHKDSAEIMVIEWDLANKPIQGSLVNAYGSQIIIPDYNNPLFHDLKPFDLCYCKKTPIKIESNIIKTINVITKCSFKDAIKSIAKGMEFIEGFYPLSLIKAVLDKEINPFQANEIVVKNPNRLFVPNYNVFVKAFKKFLLNFIFKEKEYIFEQLKKDIEINTNQILTLLNLNNELAGLELPYTQILKRSLYPNVNLKDFRFNFLNEIHSIVNKQLNSPTLGSTLIFDLKKMQHTPFFKYSNKIIEIRKDEFESTKIIRLQKNERYLYDMYEISRTYYGKKIFKFLQYDENLFFKLDKFKKFREYSSKLNLKL